MWRNDENRYGWISIGLHWLVAAIVIGLFGLGLWMVDLTYFKENGNGTAVLTGNFTLHGVTQPISIDVDQIGNGPDPWGGYRRGFAGTASFALADYGIDYDLRPQIQERRADTIHRRDSAVTRS